MKFNRLFFTISILSVIILQGCMSNDEPLDEQVTLRIAIPFESTAIKEYIQYFSAEYPNIEIELIDWMQLLSPGADYDEEFDHFMETERPDIILFNQTETFARWAREGYLVDLDPLIQADNFDLENMSENIIEYIKIQGGGKLFGLAPTFFNSALFYNRALFDEFNVPYPENYMSWEEILDLAARFPSEGDAETKIYGFAHGADFNYTLPFYLVKMISESMGMSFIDSTFTNLTMGSDGWKQIFEWMIHGIESGVIHYDVDEESTGGPIRYPDDIRKNMFAMGRAAMTIDNITLANQRLEYVNELPDDATIPDWDIVTAPVHPMLSNETNLLMVNNLYAISAQSEHLQAAWAFVKYVNGDDAAKLQANSPNTFNMLQTRSEYSLQKNGRDLSPFYMLRPLSVDIVPLPFGMFMPLYQLIVEETNAVLRNEKTLDEALETIQERGQEELMKATLHEDPNEQGG